MRVEVTILITLAVLFSTHMALVLPAYAATPAISNPYPPSGMYTTGGSKTVFVSVASDALNTSTVSLNIKSAEAVDWDLYPMSCSALGGGVWNCTVIVSLNIVGSDTIEDYYFLANDTSGNVGNLGNATTPLTFTVDVNKPVIEFMSPPGSYTYLPVATELRIRVTDRSSGVNDTTVFYSLDNSSWHQMSALADHQFSADFSTLSYANNQTLTLHFRASDMIINTAYAWMYAMVDHDQPRASVVSPVQGETIGGITRMAVNASDDYSGVNLNGGTVLFGGVRKALACMREPVGEGYLCECYFDTTQFSDGTYTAQFNVTDNAGNFVQPTVTVTTYNKQMYVRMHGISEGSYVRGSTTLNASVVNELDKVTGVQLLINGSASSGYTSSDVMYCSGDYSLCQLTWDTTQLADGYYTLSPNVTNTAGKIVDSLVTVTVDNTHPTISIDMPGSDVVNGTIIPKVVVTDDYGVQNGSVTFSVSSYSYVMECAVHTAGKMLVCSSSFDTRAISDDYYTLSFHASDIAGNINSTSKTMLVDNDEGVGPLPGATTTTVPGAAGDAATTTTAPGGAGGATTETSPPSVIQTWLQGAGGNPIYVTIWNTSQQALNNWPFKAFAISMIVFLAVLAVFRTTQVKKLFDKSEDAEKTSVLSSVENAERDSA